LKETFGIKSPESSILEVSLITSTSPQPQKVPHLPAGFNSKLEADHPKKTSI